MSARHVAITVIALALTTSALILTPSQAAPSEVRMAILHANADVSGLPAATTADTIDLDQLKESKLKDFDVLVLDASAFASAWADEPKKNALKKFAKAHRVLLVEGGEDAFEGFTDLDLPVGGDVAYDTNGLPSPVHGAARAIYRAHGGKWDTAAFEYGTRALYEKSIARDLAQWIRDLPDFQPEHGQPLQAQAADNGNWVWRATATYSYTWSPYGRLGYTADVYYAASDGTSSYKWWNVEMSQTVEPGNSLSANNWRTYQTWVTSDVQYYHPSNQLVDWNPYSSVDATLGSVAMNGEIGLVAGVEDAPVTSKQTTGYTANQMYVAQSSTTGGDDVYVRTDFNYGGAPASGLFTSKPGWTIRSTEPNCFKIPWTNKVQWREYLAGSNDNFQTNWISSWREYC